MKTSCECNDGFTTVGEAEPYVGKNRPEGRFFPTFCGLLSVALNQHQAITNITKHSIQQRIFRRKIRK
ncbi:hypothetical protein [Halpernia humi]|uniref:hypothetical protein n=1 Tax=Halpernia humi TaxID=493375 RepID=UPI0011B0BFB1|nr:hypothetical protein [Halpernia humi]